MNNKSYCRLLLASCAFAFIASASSAQTKIKDGSVGGSTSLANPGAILDLESNKRALLLPRVELSSTTSWVPLNGAAPTEGGYTVYNTSPTTTEGSAAYPVLSGGVGEYYWDGSGWVAKKYNAASVYQEPFQVATTTDKATTNTQYIYQNGRLGLGDFSTTSPIAQLDVRGAVRGGSNHTGPVGSNSAAFGSNNLASGGASIALGYSSIASGSASFAMGNTGATASGLSSFAFGQSSVASGTFTFATGVETNAIGHYSTAIGLRTLAASNGETVIGKDNAIRTGTADNSGTGYIPVPTDALFQVGNGSFSSRSNALTVLKNGNTGIAIPGVEDAAKPTSTLQVAGSLSLALRVVNGATSLTDKDHTVVYTGASSTTFTLPAANTCTGRIYRIVQYVSSPSGDPDISFDKNIYCYDIATTSIIQTTSMWAAHHQFTAEGDAGNSASLTIQSDGASWYAVGL